MTLLELLVLLAVAGMAGAVGQSISGYSHGGCLTAIAVGFVGALVGTWLARGLGLPEILALQVGGVAFPVVWATLGAAIFVTLIHFVGGMATRPRSGT